MAYLPLGPAAAPGYIRPMISLSRADRIRTLLADALAPAAMDVVDDSARHAGHSGAAAAGQTHYNVRVVSDRFAGLGRVARHRLVNAPLAEEFATGLHALSLVLQTPEEAAQATPRPDPQP